MDYALLIFGAICFYMAKTFFGYSKTSDGFVFMSFYFCWLGVFAVAIPFAKWFDILPIK